MMDVLNVTEVYTIKWLKWQILCYVYFITVKKKKKKSPYSIMDSPLLSVPHRKALLPRQFMGLSPSAALSSQTVAPTPGLGSAD